MWQPQTKEAVLREVRIRRWRAQVGQKVKGAVIALSAWVMGRLKEAFLRFQSWSAATAQEIEVIRRLSQRHDALLRLGEQVYAIYRSGNLSWESIVPLCEAIERQERELELLRQRSFVVVTDELTTASTATGS